VNDLSDETPPSVMPQNVNDSLNLDLVTQFVDTREIVNLLPIQRDTGNRLEEKQENTRSELAKFLIRMLAGTLVASFSLIIILIVMTGLVDERKKETLKETSSLVKDLVTLILTAQTGLIGTALGFYFGSRGDGND
jgi:hypothetical protein